MDQSQILHRIDQLERENRRFKRGFVGLALSAICFSFIGMSRTDEVPTVKGIRVAHADGSEAIFIGVSDGVPTMRLANAPKPGLLQNTSINPGSIVVNELIESDKSKVTCRGAGFDANNVYVTDDFDISEGPDKFSMLVSLGRSSDSSGEDRACLLLTSPGDRYVTALESADSSAMIYAGIKQDQQHSIAGCSLELVARQSSDDAEKPTGAWASFFGRTGKRVCHIGSVSAANDAGMLGLYDKHGENQSAFGPRQ